MFLLAVVMYVDDTDLHALLLGFKSRSTNGVNSLCDSLKSAKWFVNFFSYNFVNSEPHLKKVKDLPPPVHHITN